MRPSFESIYMRLAFNLAERSTCARLKVGAVITTTDFRRVLAVGYNGNVTGGKDDCDRHGEEAVGFCGCIHGEANAIINCSEPRSTEKIVFCTDMPCVMCAKYIVNLGGVVTLYYNRTYRLTDGCDVLHGAGICVSQRGCARCGDDAFVPASDLCARCHNMCANCGGAAHRCGCNFRGEAP